MVSEPSSEDTSGVLHRVPVLNIHHSQAWVSPVFSRASQPTKSHAEAVQEAGMQPLESVVAALMQGALQPEDLPPMRCVDVGKGCLCSLDNRRLWVLKEYARQSGQQALTVGVHLLDINQPLIQSELHRKLASGQLTAPVLEATVRYVGSSREGTVVPSFQAIASLPRLVLPWSCAELLANPSMLVNKIEELPLEYQLGSAGVISYTSKALWLTLEEIRAQLQQSIEQSASLTWVEVAVDERAIVPDSTDGGGIVGIQVAASEAQQAQAQQGGRAERKGPAGCKSTDIVILSSKPVDNQEQWASSEVVHSLGLVQNLVTQEDQTTAAQVSVFAHDGSSMWQRLGLSSGSRPDAQKTWYLTTVNTTATSGRVWDALQQAMGAAKTGNTAALSQILAAVLCPSVKSTPPAASPLQQQVEEHCRQQGLNTSQAEAVSYLVGSAAATVHGFCSADRCVQLIQGPPGTGKTSTLVQAVHVLVTQGKSVLVCAPTNVAVQEVATRYLQLISNAPHAYSGACWQLPAIRSTSASDVVLLANEDVVMEGAEVEAIWVKARAKRLATAMRATGIAHMVTKLDALTTRSPAPAYQEYVSRQNELMQPVQDRVTWFKDLVCGLIQQLQDCLQTVSDDLPSSMLPQDSRLACLELRTHVLPGLQHLFQTACDGEVQRLMNHLDVPANHYITMALQQQSWMPLLDALSHAAITARQATASVPKLPASVQTEEHRLYHLELLCLKHAHVVFCTVSTSGRMVLSKARRADDSPTQRQPAFVEQTAPETQEGFDVCIIDEAAQLIEAETAITLQAFPRLSYLVLVGDHKQLPATIFSQHASKMGYQRSLFERLEACQHKVHMLTVQYRMHPDISLHPRHAFYQGQITDGSNVLEASRATHMHGLQLYKHLGAYHIVDIHRGHEERCEITSSKRNRFEAQTVCYLVKKLAAEFRQQGAGGTTQLSIGIISPYSAQVALIQELLGEWVLSSASTHGVTLEVKSVDGFQGREMDIIIISTVRSNTKGNVGFLQDQRRLNVAVTRGRHAVWVFTNVRTLQADEGWGQLLENARGRGLLTQGKDIPSVTEAVKSLELLLKREADLMNPANDLFDGKPWEVVFSKEFARDIKQLPEKSRPRVVVVVLFIAEGHRPAGYPGGSIAFNQTSEAYRDLIHVQGVNGLKLVWTVDVDRAECRQIIKVWRIVKPADVLPTVRRLEAALAVYTPEAVSRCKTIRWKGKIAVPGIWQPDPSFRWTRSLASGSVEAVLEAAAVKESMLLMKFFPLDSGSARLLLSSAGANMEQMFKLNEEETQILNHNRTSFIQGRSGTGKTTVIVALLLMREFATGIHLLNSGRHASYDASGNNQANGNAASEQGQRVRQLLVTLSPKLCAAMRADISRKVQTQEQIKALSSLAGAGTESGGVHAINIALGDQLLDEEAVAKMLGDLPSAMATVPDSQCPLVLPLRHVLLMLDESMPESFAASFCWGGQPCTALEQPSSSPAFIRSEVNYEVFESQYWPTFDLKKRRNMSAAAVWTQIQSYIKGSREAAWSDKGRLSLEEYQELSNTRTGSVLSSDQREVIYSLFLKYERLKGERYEWDMCGLTCHLHHQLRQHGFPAAAQFHCVYIDEVQDLTPAQLSLFAFLCKRQLDGCVFAGDTAQTIAKGVDFRFEDIRALYYLDYLGHGSSGSGGGGTAVVASGTAGGSSEPALSDMFQLVKNYRTHAGIVKLSTTLVQALMHFFPLSVDRLQPESSMIAGPLPVMVKGDDPLDVLLGRSQGQEGLRAGASGCDFGAEQAILVRDEEYKQKLKQQLGPEAARNLLIMTAHECKGLEFQVVLIHGFFSSSPLEGGWRLLYGYMLEQGLMNEQELLTEKWQTPVFCPQRHQLLCSELKLCYVLCTRAKHCVLFYEPEPEKAEPIVEFWDRTHVIQCKPMDMEVRNMLVHESTAEEWLQRAKDLFNSGFYEHARMCSLKAGDKHLATRCEAEGLRQEGQRSRTPAERTAKYAAAAEAFLNLNLQEQAANCYVEAGQHQEAAPLFEQLKMHHRAAVQYESCSPPELSRAAQCWSNAGKLDTALQCCAAGMGKQSGPGKAGASAAVTKSAPAFKLDTGMIDLGLALVAEHENDSPPYPDLQELRTEFLEMILVRMAEALTAARAVKAPVAVKAAQALSASLSGYLTNLGDDDMQTELLERFELKDGLLDAYVKQGKHKEAALLCEELGRAEEALQHHQAAGNIAKVLATRAGLLRSACLWSHPDAQGWPMQPRHESARQLQVVNELMANDWALKHTALIKELMVGPAPANTAAEQTRLSSDTRLVLGVQVLLTLLDARHALGGTVQPQKQLEVMQGLADLMHLVARHLPGSCSELMLSLGLWHGLVDLCTYAGRLSQKALKERQNEVNSNITTTATTNAWGKGKKPGAKQPQPQPKTSPRSSPADIQGLSKVLVAASALLIEHWQALSTLLPRAVHVMELVAQHRAASTASDAGLVRCCMDYLACSPDPSCPGSVRLNMENPSWLPPHLKDRAKQGGRLTLPEFGIQACSMFKVALRDAALQVTQLVKGSGTSLARSSDTLDLPALIKAALLVPVTQDLKPTSPPSADDDGKTSTEPVRHHPLAVTANLLLAYQRALQLLSQLPSSRLGPSGTERFIEARRVVKRVMEICMLHTSAADQPVLQLPVVLASRGIEALLSRYMQELCGLATAAAAATSDFWYRYPGVDLEEFGRMLLLQGAVFENMPQSMAFLPKWFQIYGAKDAMSPWQLLAASMVYACWARRHLANAAAAVRLPGHPLTQLNNARYAVQVALQSAEMATTYGLLGCYLSLEIPHPSRPEDWYNFKLSPMTLITMMERMCTVGIAQITSLTDCSLPLSLVMRHLALPGSILQLTALVKMLRTSQQGHSALRVGLAQNARVLEAVLQDQGWLRRLFSQAGQGVEDVEAMMQQWSQRALLLLFALGLHTPSSRLVYGDAHSFSSKDALVRALKHARRILGPGLPMDLKVALEKLACAKEVSSSSLKQAFRHLVEALGDKLVVLQMFEDSSKNQPGVQQVVVAQLDQTMACLPVPYCCTFSLLTLTSPARTSGPQAKGADQPAAQAQPSQSMELGATDEEVDVDVDTLNGEAEAAEAAHLSQLQGCLKQPAVVQGLHTWQQYAGGTLTPQQALHREVCSAFAALSVFRGAVQLRRSNSKGCLGQTSVKGCVYLQLYLEKVCSLQAATAHLEEMLPRANQLLTEQLKANNRFGERNRQMDVAAVRAQQARIRPLIMEVRALQKLLHKVQPYLNPRHEQHAKLDVRWLRATVLQPLQQVLDKAELSELAAVIKQAAEQSSEQEETQES